MPGKRKTKQSKSKRTQPAKDLVVFKKITDQRRRGDMTYFKVQWEGHGDIMHTWEREENLSPQKVSEYQRTKSTSTQPAEQSMSTSSGSPVGFQRCLQAESIIGMYEVNKVLMFKMKWKGSNQSDLVPVSEAKVKCPQVVIDYYQKKIVWI